MLKTGVCPGKKRQEMTVKLILLSKTTSGFVSRHALELSGNLLFMSTPLNVLGYL